MTKRRYCFRWTAWLSLAALFLTIQGCFLGYYPDYDQTCNSSGDLQVRWVFNASPVCPVDASEVEIELQVTGGAAVVLPNQGKFDCSVREAILPALSCGDYLLRVRALDKSSNQSTVAYNSSQIPVRVLSGRINPVTVDLQIAP